MPEWYAILRTLPGFTGDLAVCRGWLREKGIAEEHAERTAIELKAKWDGPGWPYRQPWPAFQAWARRPSLERRAIPPGGDLSSEARRAEIRQMARERGQLDDDDA